MQNKDNAQTKESEVTLLVHDELDEVSGIGQGTFESTGKHRWNTKAILQLSDGRRLATEGEIDLASRSYKGRIIREMS